MCAVSMIGDHYRDAWKERDWFQPTFPATGVPIQSIPQQFFQQPAISRVEFDELKREVTEMKALLIRAKEFDRRNNLADCETDEKMDILRKVAKLVGIDLDDVIGAQKSAT